MSKILKTPIRNFSLHNILKCQERFKISNGVKILIISIAIFGAGFLSVLPAKAIEVDELVVEYWSEAEGKWIEWLPGPASFPIFSETNFLPGQDVTRLIRVTNYSESIQRIAVEAINEKNIGDLASQLDIVIKESGNPIYSKTLKQFFDDGEIYLSSLAGLGGQTQYDFTVSFKSGADNNYQGKSAGFNLLVGFEGTEGGLTLPQPGGSAGGFLPPGLTIQEESVIATTTETSVTIIWTTSYFSTSQVIYDTVSGKFNLDPATGGGPPNYGYAFSKEGDDIFGSGKGVSHRVTLTGLLPGTTYYYRCVSHGSLAVSTEHSFTTPGTKKIVAGEEAFVYEGTGSGPAGAGEAITEELPEGSVKGEATGETAVGQEESGMGLGKLLAAIGSFFGSENLWWLLIILVLILIVLFFLSRKKKKKE